MIKAGKAREEYQQILSSRTVFKIEPFDIHAAMECALLLAEALAAKDQRNIGKVKFKFDWQIVAIASSRNAQAIYSDDDDIDRYAKRINIPVYKTDNLPLPVSTRQHELPFDE